MLFKISKWNVPRSTDDLLQQPTIELEAYYVGMNLLRQQQHVKLHIAYVQAADELQPFTNSMVAITEGHVLHQALSNAE